MKRGTLFLFISGLICGMVLAGFGLYMSISINSPVALLKLPLRTVDLFILVHKWLIITGAVLVVISGLLWFFKLRKAKAKI